MVTTTRYGWTELAGSDVANGFPTTYDTFLIDLDAKLDSVCTAATRPGTVRSGQRIWESDTELLYVSNGSAPASASWRAPGLANVFVGANADRAGGAGVIALKNASTAPSGSPSGGAVLYAKSGGVFAKDNNGLTTPVLSPPNASAAPSAAFAETIPRALASSQTGAMVSGTLQLQAIWLPAGLTVSNISYITGSTAATTPTNWWFALLDNTRTLRAHCTNQTTGAIAANTLITKAMITPFVTTYSGLHYVGIMVTATTPPTLTVCGLTAANIALTSPIVGGASTTGLTTPGTDASTVYAAITSTSYAMPYAYVS